MNDKNFNVATKFRLFRWICGLTQEEFASAQGVTLRTVQNWEHGLNINEKALKYLCGCYSCMDYEVKVIAKAASEQCGHIKVYSENEYKRKSTLYEYPYSVYLSAVRLAYLKLLREGYDCTFVEVKDNPDEERRKEDKMDTITYTAARQNMAELMDEVTVKGRAKIITHNGKSSVVMMSLDDYNAWLQQVK